eukprot:EG_transcript_5262
MWRWAALCLAMGLGGSASSSPDSPLLPDLHRLVQHATQGPGRGRAYARTAVFADRFGWRMAGTANLEAAIDDLRVTLLGLGLDNVHHEPVAVPHWERGLEAATLLEPLVGGAARQLPLKSFGGSVPTPPAGFAAPVLVVADFHDLLRRRAEVPGKIVLFVYPWRGYNNAVLYRLYAHQVVAMLGGLAALIRSAASFSLATPHTGCLSTDDVLDDPDVPRELHGDYSNYSVPSAGLTVEDAELLRRIAGRGQAIRLHLTLGCTRFPDAPSRNTVAEVVGSKYPDQVVLVAGHVDSWDVGQGVVDDAGPLFVALEVLALLRDLGLRPLRTVRFVAFVAEEWGEEGARQYFADHQNESMVLVSELDEGIWNVDGVVAAASPEALAVLRGAEAALAPLNATAVVPRGDTGGLNGLGLDVSGWTRKGVPTLALAQHATSCFVPPRGVDGFVAMDVEGPAQHFQGDYFFYHHTDADTVAVLDSDQMDRAAAVLAVYAYLAASVPDPLPQGNFVPQLPASPLPNAGGLLGQPCVGEGMLGLAVAGAFASGAAIGVSGVLCFLASRRGRRALEPDLRRLSTHSAEEL